MTEVRKLLEEAVGPYEPRGDLGSVERRVERRRRRQRLSAGVVAFAVFAAAVWITWGAFRPGDGTPGSTPTPASGSVVVPGVVGLSQDEARTTLEDLGLVVTVAAVSSDQVPEGVVAIQDPRAGVTTDRGSTVTIGVSGGRVLVERAALAAIPDAGVVVGFEDSVAFVALNGTSVTTLDGYTLAGNPGAPGVWLQRGERYFSLGVEEHALVPVPDDEAQRRMHDEGPAPQLAPPPGPAGAESPGRWRYALDSASGTTLAQWSGACEVPTAYLIDPGGTARLVTGESDPSIAPASLALGWAGGEAVVLVVEAACAGSVDGPGIYLYSSPGAGRLLYPTDAEPITADAWGTGI